MSTCWVTLVPTETSTRVLVMQGQDEVLRAVLPPFSQVKHEQGVARFLEALSLWFDQRVCVALCAGPSESSFRLGLVDELYAGARSVFYAVEPVPREARRPGRRVRGLGDFTEERQLWLCASTGGES
jgi:hypothetical protein